MSVLDDLKGFMASSKQKVGGVAGLSKKHASKYELTPQSDEEKRKIGILEAMLEEGKRAREPWEAGWRTGFEYLVGRHYPARRKRHKANPKYNYLWRNTEAMTSRLTKNNPTINVVSSEPVATEHVNAVQKQLSHWWEELNMRRKITDGTRTTLTFGKNFYYTYWDHEAGQPCTELVSPKCIYVNDHATSIEDATWLAHLTTMPIWKVLSYWPNAKGKIAPGTTTVNEPMPEIAEMAPPDPTDEQPVVFDMRDSTTVYRAYGQPDYFGDGDEDTDMVQVVQFWIRDPATTKEPLKWDDGLPAMFPDGSDMWLEKPKYPGGRLIVMAGRRIIHDAANPFEHGEFPYVDQNCYGVPDEFWCMSFVYNQISPQKELNKTLAQIVENKNQIAQPRVIAEKSTGFDPQMDTSKPGMVWNINPGTMSGIQVVQMPNMPAYMMDLVSFSVGAMKEISGVTDTSVGIKEPGVQSGVALQTLALQSQTQSGVLEANLEDAIRRLGKQWIGLARQYMEESKHIQTTNEQGEPVWQELTPEMIKNEWGVRVGVGSTLPVDRSLLMQQAMEMFQIQLFDEEAALEWSQHPGAQAILARLRERKAMQAQAQQMSAQIQQGGEGGEAPPPEEGAPPE